jgi:hypothetical protein
MNQLNGQSGLDLWRLPLGLRVMTSSRNRVRFLRFEPMKFPTILLQAPHYSTLLLEIHILQKLWLTTTINHLPLAEWLCRGGLLL